MFRQAARGGGPARGGIQVHFGPIDEGASGSGGASPHMFLQQLLSNLIGPEGGGPGGAGFGPHLHGQLYGNPGDYAWGRGGLDEIVTHLLNQMDGAGPPPLSENTIEAIPTVQVTQSHIGTYTDGFFEGQAYF